MVDTQPARRFARRQDACGSYDVVVIGGGLAGLTAGALLAHAGRRVLVVEADAAAGGCARSMQYGGYTLDRADHLTTSCQPAGPFGPGVIDAVLRELGVRDLCDFALVGDPFYEARFPGFRLAVPCGHEPFLEAHLRHFPAEAQGLRRLMNLSAQLYRETTTFPLAFRPSDVLRMRRRWPALLRYGAATMQQVIDRELHDPRLRSIYSTLCWGWLGAAPSQASFVAWGVMMGAFVDDGAYYPRGGFQRLADALVAGLKRNGGELLLGAQAVRIHTSGGRATGVELADGGHVTAPTVISAIDARTTFEDLVGVELLPARFVRRMRRRELSPSVVSIHVATDLDARAAGAHHDTSVAHTWDLERVVAEGMSGRIRAAHVVIPSLTDPSLAPPGEHVVMVQAAAGRESGEMRGDDGRIADVLLSYAEEVLPGLRERLTFIEPGAPQPTVHRVGTIYGWSNSPSQTGLRRLAQITPVDGLILAGQWTRPGGATVWVIQSGIQAARHALGAPTSVPPLPLGLPRAPTPTGSNSPVGAGVQA